MKSLANQVSLVGRLGAQPEIMQLENGNKMARFSIAINERVKTKEGTWMDDTHWHNVVAWGKTAERAEKLLTKGSNIMAQGKLVNRSYEAKSGEKRYVTEVTVNDFLLLSMPKKEAVTV